MTIFKNIVENFFNSLGCDKKASPNIEVPSTVFVNTINSLFSIPARPEQSITGSELANKLINTRPNQEREDAFFVEYASGNVPNFLKHHVEITLNSGANSITYHVLPDYLCIGTDDDFIRTPLTPLTAKRIADLYGAILPTTKIVNQIWKSASVKLEPKPNGPPYDEWMQSIDALLKNENAIKKQLDKKDLGKLIAGHKKDIVITNKLLQNPSRVAIYGWHQLNGKVIQGLNVSSHDKLYKDYSHGIRLISRKVIVNDKIMDIYDVLNDRVLHSLISDETTFDASKIYLK